MLTQGRSRTEWTLIGVVVVGLLIDAAVHLDLASAFAGNRTGVVSEATIFRLEAAVSVLVALAVLIRPRWYTALLAVLVGGSAVAAAVVYRYVDVGRLGPLPNMYDPYWAPVGKVLSLVAEAAATIAAAGLFVLLRTRSREPAPQPRMVVR